MFLRFYTLFINLLPFTLLFLFFFVLSFISQFYFMCSYSSSLLVLFLSHFISALFVSLSCFPVISSYFTSIFHLVLPLYSLCSCRGLPPFLLSPDFCDLFFFCVSLMCLVFSSTVLLIILSVLFPVLVSFLSVYLPFPYLSFFSFT